VVVANRASGDLSVIDVATMDVDQVPLPNGPNEAEPMYVSHDPRHDRVLVGDRASNAVVAFDDETYEVVASVPVGEGVFHQWLDTRRHQLWVVGDVANTVTVLDTRDLSELATIDIPADLTARRGKPHDVFVSGRHAFVSIIGLDTGEGVVVRYSTRDFEETGRITTGGDPHLFVDGGRLYVASQDASTVSAYQPSILALLGSIDVPSAHGIYVTNRNEVLVTNITGGAVHELDRRLTDVVDTVDTAVPVPHNLIVDDARRTWVTHSGATADHVSVIHLDRHGFGSIEQVTVGTNPFGLAFVD
jgi:DNA-binding beta-propeller fold protein YncE